MPSMKQFQSFKYFTNNVFYIQLLDFNDFLFLNNSGLRYTPRMYSGTTTFNCEFSFNLKNDILGQNNRFRNPNFFEEVQIKGSSELVVGHFPLHSYNLYFPMTFELQKEKQTQDCTHELQQNSASNSRGGFNSLSEVFLSPLVANKYLCGSSTEDKYENSIHTKDRFETALQFSSGTGFFIPFQYHVPRGFLFTILLTLLFSI